MPLIYLFVILMAVMYPLAHAAENMSGSRDGRIGGTDNTGAKVMVILIFLIFAFVLGFRGISAAVNDEYAYRNRVIRMVGRDLGEAVKGTTEWLDTLCCWIVARIFPGESQWVIVYYTVVAYACFVAFIYKNCDHFGMGIMMLFLLNIVNVSLNTMQQMVAVAVAAMGIPYVIKRNFIKYAVIILIAALFHNSAIVLIAIYFIANMKPWSGKFIGIAFLFVIIMVLFNTVAPDLFSRMEILEEYDSSYGSGVKTITVIVAFVPVLFAFFMKSYFPTDDDELNVAINMALVYAMIYIVSTQNKYVARFAMYLQPYLIILYTRALTYLRKENLSTITTFVLFAGYGATMVYFVQQIKYRFLWVL